MVFINEWLPNPSGNEAKGEFIELFNSGSAPISLNGWILKTSGKKSFSFGAAQIAPNGYLVLKRTDTKLTLKNSGESVYLYDSAGHLVDQSSFLGMAPSGKSYSRMYYPGGDGDLNATAQPQSFAWGTPTPGATNKADLHNGIAVNNYPIGVPLNHASANVVEALGMAITVGVVVAASMMYCLKHEERFAKLVFGRDDENGI